MGISKKEILNDIFLLHWDWDAKPDFSGTDDEPTADIAGSVEALILEMYPRFKEDALSSYNWRSAIGYKTITCTEPVTNTDPRYKYTAPVPDDFIKLVGLWEDEERYRDARNRASVVGETVFSHLEEITIGYMANKIETAFDNWLSTYMIAYIASAGATLAGVSNDKRAELIGLEQNKWFKCSTVDFEMAQKDEISPSLQQFLIS